VSERSVGPVLSGGSSADAVVAAICAANSGVEVVDHGAYVSVFCEHRCQVTREAIEARLGRPFALPPDLEAIMPSFRGRFSVDSERATWQWDA
jgi:hypothetical protein